MVKIICPTLMQWESGINIQITGYEGNPFDLRVQFNYVGDTRGKLEPVRQDFSCVIPDHYLTESRMLYIAVVNVNCCKHDTVGYVLKQIYRCAKPTGGSDGCSNSDLESLERRVELLEKYLSDDNFTTRFDTFYDAERWAVETQSDGSIIAVHNGSSWMAYIVQDDYSLSPLVSVTSSDVLNIACIDGGSSIGI